MSLLPVCRLTIYNATKVVPHVTRSLATVAGGSKIRDDLHKIKSTFRDKDGLFNKIGLISRLLSPDTTYAESITLDPEQKTLETPMNLRIGLIGMKTSLLDTILADPFASEQAWFEEFKNRGKPHTLEGSALGNNRLIKYSDSFERRDDVWRIPTPFLNPQLRNGLEFLEIDEDGVNDGDDGCHLYFSFNDKLLNGSIRNWPVYSWTDVEPVDLKSLKVEEIKEVQIPKLTINEINSELAEYAIELLRKSPKNSTIYTKLYPHSNVLNLIQRIDQLINDKQSITLKLYESVLSNVENQLLKNSLTLKELDDKNERITKYINNWNELTHHEFQQVFKPFVNQYERKHLSWWKLYYKADEIKQILRQMFDTQLLNDSLRNYSYVKGQIDSFSSFPVSNTNVIPFEFSKELSELPTSNALTQIKDDLIITTSANLQKEAIKLLLFNFVGLQFPVILISILGHTLYDFSNYSMIALGSLGLVAGFNKVSKKWVSLIEAWKSDIFEKIRIAINEENKKLVSEWEERLKTEQDNVKERENLIHLLKDDLNELKK